MEVRAGLRRREIRRRAGHFAAGRSIDLTAHATVLVVQDVRRAADYYRDRLGFDVTFFDQNPDHYAYASRDAVHFHFARILGTPPRPHELFAAYVYVDDIDALYGELVERGADVIQAPMEQPYGLREIRVRDPDGYVVAFGKLLD